MNATLAKAGVAAGLLLLAGGIGAAVLFGTGSSSPSGDPVPAPPRDIDAPTGGAPAAFSATITRRFERGEQAAESQTFVARRGDWSRTEWREGERRFAAIVRPDLNTTYLVDLVAGEYTETPIAEPPPPESAPPLEVQVEVWLTGAGPSAATTRTRTGTESINGFECIVYRSTIEAPSGGRSESTVWEASKLGGLAIRSCLVGPDGATTVTEMSDIGLDPPESLFEPPPGARRVEAHGGP